MRLLTIAYYEYRKTWSNFFILILQYFEKFVVLTVILNEL